MTSVCFCLVVLSIQSYTILLHVFEYPMTHALSWTLSVYISPVNQSIALRI